jgi:hypothetical protein
MLVGIVSNSSINITPLTLGCNILFTSRRHFELPGVSPHDVKTLSAESSYQLLTKDRKPLVQEEKYAHSICSRVGYLPLALVLGQAFLKKSKHISFRVYDEQLAKNRLYTVDFGKASKEQLAATYCSSKSYI